MYYKNAPIQEAVFDIRVDKVSNTDIESYESYAKSNFEDYSKHEKKVLMGSSFKINKKNLPPEVSSTQSITGFIFSQPNGNKKIQFRRDGYTFNMVKPYSNWDEFSELAFNFWNHYKENVDPKNINRIALRFINRIELPLNDDFDFDHYFKNIPTIPPVLEQKFNRFFLQMQVPCKGNEVIANITQTFDNPDNEKLHFILDIDVFSLKNWEASKDLRGYFNELRIYKNNIFESLITDHTRKLFN